MKPAPRSNCVLTRPVQLKKRSYARQEASFQKIRFLIIPGGGSIATPSNLQIEMAQQEFFDELSDEFPPLHIYSCDESFHYETERLRLMDEVLDGTFETYSRVETQFDFRYTIIADASFELEVAYKDNIWIKSFVYIAEAFDTAEAAYRFLIVMPRVLDEGETVV